MDGNFVTMNVLEQIFSRCDGFIFSCQVEGFHFLYYERSHIKKGFLLQIYVHPNKWRKKPCNLSQRVFYNAKNEEKKENTKKRKRKKARKRGGGKEEKKSKFLSLSLGEQKQQCP